MKGYPGVSYCLDTSDWCKLIYIVKCTLLQFCPFNCNIYYLLVRTYMFFLIWVKDFLFLLGVVFFFYLPPFIYKVKMGCRSDVSSHPSRNVIILLISFLKTLLLECDFFPSFSKFVVHFSIDLNLSMPGCIFIWHLYTECDSLNTMLKKLRYWIESLHAHLTNYF